VHVETHWTKNVELYWADNRRLVEASKDLHQLFGQAVGLAIIGSTEQAAMAGFNAAWREKHAEWRNHLPLVRGA
jgi:glutamate/tyrosine decarboxylase-like PLP-dependent enzyme